MEELWLPLRRTNGIYEVSNHGRLRRVAPAMGTHPGRLRSLSIHPKSGYVHVGYSVNDRELTAKIHRLVAEEFLPPPPSPLHEINHIDRDKTNNRADNLEWATHLDNVRHSRFPGSHKWPRGSKLSEEDVLEIRRRAAAGENRRALAKSYGVHWTHIYHVLNGTARRNIPLDATQTA